MAAAYYYAGDDFCDPNQNSDATDQPLDLYLGLSSSTFLEQNSLRLTSLKHRGKKLATLKSVK